MKKTILVAVFMFTAFTICAVTNTWDGSFNAYWHNANNWSQGHIPLSSEDVVITTSGYTPAIDYYDEVCNSLVINSGAILEIADQSLTVNNNVTIYGELGMMNTSAVLDITGNISWESGSTASMTASATIFVSGSWYFQSGANVQLNSGFVKFRGLNKYIYNYDSGCRFNHIRLQDNSTIRFAGSSTDIFIDGNIYIADNSTLGCYSTDPVSLRGFINNMSGSINLTHGTFIFDGTTQTGSFQAGDYFNNLTISSSGTTSFNDDVTINNDLVINTGTFNLNGNTIDVTNDVDINGTLQMTNSSDVLNIGNDIKWHSGSSDNITAGTINVSSDWAFYFGTNAQLGTGNTVNFYNWTSFILCNESFASFGNIEVNDDLYLVGAMSCTTDVSGNLIVNPGNTFSTQYHLMEVDGIINVTDGGVLICNGGLINNSDFTLYGEMSIGGGDVLINGGFELASTGTLTIEGGSFVSEGEAIFNPIYGTLNMTEGLYHAKDQTRIKSSAITNISGGTIRSSGFVAQYASNFQPTGGTVEIQAEDLIYSGLLCINGNYFHNLQINPTTGNGASISSDLEIQNNLEITSGQLLLNSYEVTVSNNVDIYGHIGMTNPAANLIVGNNITWYSGSSEFITNGTINVFGDWTFENGTTASLETGNTVNFLGNGIDNSIIYCMDADAEFGNVGSNKVGLDTWIHHTSTQPMRVAGNMTIQSGEFHISYSDLIVDGVLDIQAGTSLEMIVTSSLTNNSDFTLNGELDVDWGDALIHGNFDIATGGTLTIDGGSFICDAPYSSIRSPLGGNFNLSTGLFEITYNPLILGTTFNANISGGIIRVGYWFSAGNAGTFQPSGGTLELSNGTSGGNITCYNGNYFHDLIINDDASIYLNSDITINNDLLINSGTFNLHGYEVDVNEDVEISGILQMIDSDDMLYVGDEIVWKSGSSDNITLGNIYSPFWIFNDGTNAQLGTGNTVHISNAVYSNDADAKFGNLECGAFSRIETSRNRIPQPLRVSGNYTLKSGANWSTNVDIIVDGLIDIEDGAFLTVNNSSTITTDSAFTLNGDLDLSSDGNALVHGSFELAATGELTIGGGDFICDTPYTGYSRIYGTFNQSDGLFEVTNNSLQFTSTCTDNISGGTIRVGKTFSATNSGTFEPSGGSVDFSDANSGGSIMCTNGNHFYDLIINDDIFMNYDLTVNNDLIINSGYLDLYNHTLDVSKNVEIYAHLQMTNIPDLLNVGKDIIWYSGSTELVSNGTINVSEDWIFESGTNAQIGAGNTVYFKGNNNSVIRCDDSDAEFGNLIIDKPVSRGASYIHSSSTENLHVVGDMTVNEGNIFHIWHQHLLVDGVLDIEDTALVDIISGTLTNNSDFVLNGELDVGSGDALIHGVFDLSSTGILTITGGSFIYDEIVTGNDIYGTLNISEGLYQAEETIYIQPSANMNVNGGTIATTSGFYVQSGAVFQPSGGSVDFISDLGSGGILCDGTNYFYDLTINALSGGGSLQSDTKILNNLSILSGSLQTNNFNIEIEGDWANNVGVSGFSQANGTVTFSGNQGAQITTDETFYDLIINKTNLLGDIVEIPANNALSVTHNLNINDGILEMNDNSVLKIGNELNVNNDGTIDITCTAGNEALISKYYGSYYDFSIESGGTIRAEYAFFEYMSTSGVNVKSEAILHPLHCFHNCSFSNGETDGSLLTIDNNQILTINNAEFYAGSRDALYNISKNVDTGEITFTNTNGSFDGPDNENDPNDRIYWPGFVVPDAPINLSIVVSGTDVVLNWDSVSGADSYKVYSSDDPEGGWILEQGDISGLTWSESIPVTDKFYYVTANTGVIRRIIDK